MFAKDNPFSKLPREEVEENLLGGLPDNWLGRFIQKSPRLKKFIVDVFHSKEVIPGLVQIVLQEKKIKLCGYMAIFCLLSYWIGGYFLTRHKRYLTDRIKAKLPLFLGLTVLNLGTFYYFFSKEITPFLKVFFAKLPDLENIIGLRNTADSLIMRRVLGVFSCTTARTTVLDIAINLTNFIHRINGIEGLM
jgi:hypothetical protein